TYLTLVHSVNSDVEEEVTRNVLFASFSCVTGTAASSAF
ncbi:transposase, partial [Streptococcus agalactiae CF01173]